MPKRDKWEGPIGNSSISSFSLSSSSKCYSRVAVSLLIISGDSALSPGLHRGLVGKGLAGTMSNFHKCPWAGLLIYKMGTIAPTSKGHVSFRRDVMPVKTLCTFPVLW